MRFDSHFTFMLGQEAVQHLVARRRRAQALKRWRWLPSYALRRQARRQRRQFQQELRRQRHALLRRKRRMDRHKALFSNCGNRG